MKEIKVVNIAFLLSLFSVTLFSQSDSVFSFSLVEAQNFASDNFYMSKNAQLDVESAKKQVLETTAIGLPQVSGGVDYTYIPEVPEVVFGGYNYIFSTLPNDHVITAADLNNPNSVGLGFIPGEPVALGVEHNVSYNVMVNQLLFSGEYIVGLQASKTFKQLSEEAYEKTLIEVKDMVSGSYYSILILEKNKELLGESLENLKDLYNEAKKTTEVGLMESTDADQLLVNVTRTENSLKSIDRQIEFMYNMFKYQLGLPVETEIQLTEDIDDLILRNLIPATDLYEFKLDNHIDYKMLDTQEKINSLSLNREKSTYLPTISAFYKYEDKMEKAALDFTMKHMVGVSLSVPIFSSGMKTARVSKARIELEKIHLKKEQESEKIKMMAEQAQFDYLSALDTYQNEKSNFTLSEKIFNNTTIKYSNGMVSSMDLTLANNQFLQAQLSLSGAILELMNAKTKLDKAYSKL
ncbi:MAG: TolC family protein [Bacteroidales bacterium]|nr:TolC family protein [Bacteroidales bacterium]MBN2820816.1 TolC family protein [Bacteroidales bacterium]